MAARPLCVGFSRRSIGAAIPGRRAPSACRPRRAGASSPEALAAARPNMIKTLEDLGGNLGVTDPSQTRWCWKLK
jgi:hypothetical protein